MELLVLARLCGRNLFHYVRDGETRSLGARRKVLEAFKVPRHDPLRRHKKESSVRGPIGVKLTGWPALERIGAQVVQHGDTQFQKVALPNAERSFGVNLGMLLHE